MFAKCNASLFRRLLIAISVISMFTVPSLGANTPITLRWLADVSGGPERLEFYEAVAAEFNRTHDDIQVELEPVPNFALYYERLTLQMAAGLAPDLVFSNSPSNIAEGFYLDLTPFIESDPQFHLPDFIEAAVGFGQATSQTGLYALPNHLSTHGLYYNVAMFTGAGLSTPNEMVAQGDWSWDSFHTAGQRIIVRDADGRLQRGLVSALNFEMFYSTFGARMIGGKDGVEYSTVRSPEMMAALEMWAALHARDRLIGGGGRNAFLGGQVAMNTHWNDLWPLYADAAFEIDVVRYPWSDQSQSVMIAGGGWAIPQNAKHPEASWELMKFVTGELAQSLYGRLAGGVPGRTRVAVEVWMDPSWGPRNKQQAFLDPILEHGVVLENMTSPAWSEIQPLVTPITRELASGSISPGAAIDRIEHAVVTALGR